MKVIVPIYNTQGFNQTVNTLAQLAPSNTTFMLVSGNMDKALDVTWVNRTAKDLKGRFPLSTVVIATAGLAHVRILTAQVTSPVEGVVYIYEPNFANEPEFTWDFEATLESFATVRSLAHANNLRAIGKPTGRPLYQKYLYKHRWDYAALSMEVDELFVQTQTYCKKGSIVFAGALERLVTQLATRRQSAEPPSPVSVQISVDPASPNGVGAESSRACLESVSGYVRKGELAGVMVWWSPRFVTEAAACLEMLNAQV